MYAVLKNKSDAPCMTKNFTIVYKHRSNDSMVGLLESLFAAVRDIILNMSIKFTQHEKNIINLTCDTVLGNCMHNYRNLDPLMVSNDTEAKIGICTFSNL